MLKSDTIEKEGKTIKRQLEFNPNFYQAADDMLTDENKALGLFKRSNKKHLKDFLPELLEDGIKFRTGKVFTPKNLIGKLVRDPEWIALKAAAETAIENLRKFEKNPAKSSS